MSPSRSRSFGGFTFIELMVTLAIMSVLVSIAMPVAQIMVQRQKERALREALFEIRHAIDAYKRAAEQGRIADVSGGSGYPATLEQLVDGVDDLRSPARSKLYFLRKLPVDPMAVASTGNAVNSWGLRSSTSSSTEPREGRDVFDVYSKSGSAGLNGVPYSHW